MGGTRMKNLGQAGLKARGASLKISGLLYCLLISISANAGVSQDLLTRDLSKAIIALPRETRMYHYFWLQDDGFRSIDKIYSKASNRYSVVQNRASGGSWQFWDLNNHNTYLSNAGLGLYLAVDPFASSPGAAADSGMNFGTSMMEMTFRPGTRYFNSSSSVVVQQDTINALLAENVLNSAGVAALMSGRHFTRDTVRYMVEPQYYNFRKMVQSIFRGQGVVLVEYGWQGAVRMLCGGRSINSAMVYIGNGGADASVVSNILVYWPGFSKAQLDPQEQSSLSRNQTLRMVLQDLRPQEKRYRATTNSSDKKALLQSASKYVTDTYAQNPAELEDIRNKTFKCLK